LAYPEEKLALLPYPYGAVLSLEKALAQEVGDAIVTEAFLKDRQTPFIQSFVPAWRPPRHLRETRSGNVIGPSKEYAPPHFSSLLCG
jgi:hypothetical protein